MSADRSSRPEEPPPTPRLTPDEHALLETDNGFHQFNRMMVLIETAIRPGVKFRLRPSTLMDLNRVAVDGLMSAPGTFRLGGIGIENATYVPPPPERVAEYVDDMCDYVLDNWSKSAIHLAAYVLWRLNWIHPFRDGNGRTARAVSYLVLCARLGCKLPGTTAIPDRIKTAQSVYYSALEAADRAYASNNEIDVTEVEKLLSSCLAAQLHGLIIEAETGAK